jgi:hypothetical protein
MKKGLVISGIILFLLVFSGVVIVAQNKKTTPNSEKKSETVQIRPTPTLVERIAWDDPAGFKFTYDPGLNINKHDEDTVNYAHVEIESSSHPGTIIIWAKDTTAADAASWVRTEKEFKGANVIDSTFGAQDGKKVVITTPKRKIVTGTIYDGLLFYAEMTGEDQTYWQNEYDKIITSFTFNPTNPNSTGNSTDNSSEGGTAVDNSAAADEEETLQ